MIIRVLRMRGRRRAGLHSETMVRPTSDAAPIRPSHQESRARAVVARLMEMPMDPRM